MRPIYIPGHKRGVTCVTFNQDGDLLFTSGQDGIIQAFKSNSGARLGTYHIRARGALVSPSVTQLDVTYDSSRLLAISADYSAYVFDVETGEMLSKVEETGAGMSGEWCRHPQQNRFMMAVHAFMDAPHNIKVYDWDVDTAQYVKTLELPGFASRVTRCAWGPFDEYIISAHEDGFLRLWDAKTLVMVKEVSAHDKEIRSLAFNRSRTLMVSCSPDQKAHLWSLPDLEKVRTYSADRPLNGASVSPLLHEMDIAKIMCPLFDNLEGEELESAMVIKPHLLLGGGQERDQVTTSAEEGKFEGMLWHINHAKCLGQMGGHFGPINTLCFMPDGRGYASGGEEGYVRIYHFDEQYEAL
ncbi:MAG: uncharacterized protein KVP18_005267 [Porospora cf. gigantea A]|uniref:uncharacterized protein n=1 Tax=Porospora cf. gigantea A TaxID=2853593 RepID=UPI00355A0BDB|nr:MAG: hypothetical protein KVP18_005267 [Porospora cf. gigantea A]